MLEALYTDPRAVVADSEEWTQLRAVRDSFVTKDAVRKYVSEVHGQKGMKKLDALLKAGEKERAQKHMYIMLRLAALALQLLRDDTLRLWHEGDARQHLLDVRSGTCTPRMRRHFRRAGTCVSYSSLASYLLLLQANAPYMRAGWSSLARLKQSKNYSRRPSCLTSCHLPMYWTIGCYVCGVKSSLCRHQAYRPH